MTVHVCGSHRITIEKILASSERAQNVLAVWTNNACKHRNESLPPSTWLTCPSYRIQIGMSVTHFQRIVLCTHTWHVSVYAIAQRPSSYATVHTLPPVVQCRAMGHHQAQFISLSQTIRFSQSLQSDLRFSCRRPC